MPNTESSARAALRAIAATLLCALVLLATNGCGGRGATPQAPAPPPGADPLAPRIAKAREAIAAAVTRERERRGMPAYIVAAFDDTRTLFVDSYGPIAPPPHTVQAGAVAQLVTAILALQARDRGELDLEARIDTFPEPFRSARPATATAQLPTVRDLLSHHAGYPSDHFAGRFATRPQPLIDHARDVLAEGPVRPPRTAYALSVPGMNLVGALLELQTGRPFESLARERLFDAAGMTSSTLVLSPAVLRSLPPGHTGDGVPIATLPTRDVPASGLIASTDDLIRLGQLLLRRGEIDGRRIVSARSVEDMFSPQNEGVVLDASLRTGLGVGMSGIRARQDRKSAWVYATDYYTHLNFVLRPDERVGVVVYSNYFAGGRGTWVIAQEAINQLNDARLGDESVYGDAPTSATLDALAALAAASADTTSTYIGDPVRTARHAGTWDTLAGIFRVQASGQNLRVPFGLAVVQLLPTDADQYVPRVLALGLVPIPIPILRQIRITFRETGDIQGMLVRFGKDELLVGTRIEPVPIPTAWREACGTYIPDPAYPVEGPRVIEQFDLEVTDDLLRMDMTVPLLKRLGVLESIALALAPDSTPARIAGGGAAQGEVAASARVRGIGRWRGDRVRLLAPDPANPAPRIVYSGLVFRRQE